MTTPYTGVTSGSGVRQVYTTSSTGLPTTGYGTTGGYTTTTGYHPATYETTYGGQTVTYPGTTQTYVSGPVTTQTYVSAPVTTTQTYTTGGYSGSAVGLAGTQQRVVAEEIPVESRIEYIPFERKYVEYDRVERIERVPFEREIVEYEEVVHTERIPIERTITDYYAVETQIEYIPKEIEETIVEYEPIERTWERVQYLPVETQIVHYPEREKYVAGKGGQYISANTTTHQVAQYATNSGSHYVSGGQYVSGGSQYVSGGSQYVSGGQHVSGGHYVSGGQYVSGTSHGYGGVTTTTVPATTTTTTYQTVPQTGVAGSSYYVSGSRVGQGQSFVSGAHGTGSNYAYTSGGPIETSTYTSAGYAQPISNYGYTTADGTHLTSTGHIINNYSTSDVKGNVSYQTSA